MTEWKTYKLSDLCDYVTSRTTRIENYISTENMLPNKGGVCAPSNEPSGTAIEYKVGDILISNIRPYFQKIWQADCNGACSADVLCIRANNKADSKYLYYLLSQQLFFDYVMAGAKGCKMPRGDKKQIMQWQISLPSLEEQRRIAGILGAIDDKIENNRRINTNLELQAQALFDKIFFDDKDVERNPLSDYANINPTRTLRQGVVARYIEMANLPTKGSFPSDWSYKSYGGGCKFANGDTIMARITPCLENGKTAYIDFLEEQEVAFGSTEYIVISAKSGYCPALFYFLARNKEFVDYAVGHMNGSSGRQRVGGVDIANFPMPHITLEDSNKFAEIAMPIMDVIRNNSLENRQLATLRDTLLPKLMNGEIKM